MSDGADANAGVRDTIRREGIATVSDPACGAAGMLIAYAECLLEADINPSMHMFGSCIDIDPVAADMAFIQLSLLGIAAEVVTGNTHDAVPAGEVYPGLLPECL